MVKQFCDICGEEIESPNEGSMFKLKKREYSFTESWWERLNVHNWCWACLCHKIKEARDGQTD